MNAEANQALESFSKVAALWLNLADPLRHRTVLALQVSTGRSAKAIETALSNAWGALTQERLATFAHSERLHDTERRGTVLIVAPATTFTAWLPTVVTCWLAGFDCRLKPSRYEPIFAAAFLESLCRVSPKLAERLIVSSWRQGLPKESDIVVAFGSDDTIRQIQKETPDRVAFVGYGNKLSVGVIYEEALKTEEDYTQTVHKLEDDLLPFDLDGCLSPQIVMVEGDKERLRKALQAHRAAIPEIKSFSSQRSLREELTKLSPFVSAVGWAGEDRRLRVLREIVQELGASRLCPIGEMQKPPIDWDNGADLLGALRRTAILAKGEGKP